MRTRSRSVGTGEPGDVESTTWPPNRKPAPSVSQHLAKLRMARLVRTRREGTTHLLQPGRRRHRAIGHRRSVQRRTRGTRRTRHHRDASGLATLHQTPPSPRQPARAKGLRERLTKPHPDTADRRTPPRRRPQSRAWSRTQRTRRQDRRPLRKSLHRTATTPRQHRRCPESGAAGIRAVKISLLALVRTSTAQLVIVTIRDRWRCWPTPSTTSPTP